MRNLMRAGLVLVATVLTCFSQPVGRPPQGGSSTNIFTSSINGIDTTQFGTNAAGILFIKPSGVQTNQNLKGTTAITGATVANGLTNQTLTPGALMIVGADKQESSSSITESDLITHLSGGGDSILRLQGTGVGTSFVGPVTNSAATLGTINNSAGAWIFDNRTNLIDKSWVIKAADYYAATNIWTALRGTATSSEAALHLGGGHQSDISPESIYIYTGLRGISNNAAAWRFNKVVNNPKFLPVTDNVNDIGDSSTWVRDIYMKGKLLVALSSFGRFYDGGTGSPENVVTGDAGALFISNNGIYVKALDSIGGDSSRGWTLWAGIGAIINGSVERTNSLADSLTQTGSPTNSGVFYTIKTNWVLGQRYTNTTAGGFGSRRSTVSSSIACTAAVGGIGQVTLYVETGTTITNRATVSAEAIAGLINKEFVTLRVGPGDFFRFEDESSGGGSVSQVANTGSWVGE